MNVKKIFSVPNIIMLVQILLSAVVTVMIVLYKSYHVSVVVGLQISAFVGALIVRFTEPIAEFGKILYNMFYIEEERHEKDIVAMCFFLDKILAYIFIIVQIVFLFV